MKRTLIVIALLVSACASINLENKNMANEIIHNPDILKELYLDTNKVSKHCYENPDYDYTRYMRMGIANLKYIRFPIDSVTFLRVENSNSASYKFQDFHYV